MSFQLDFVHSEKKGGGNFTNSVLLYTFFPIYLNIMAAGNKWKVFSSRTRSNIFICPLTGVCPRFDRKWKVVKNTLLRWFLLYVCTKTIPMLCYLWSTFLCSNSRQENRKQYILIYMLAVNLASVFGYSPILNTWTKWAKIGNIVTDIILRKFYEITLSNASNFWNPKILLVNTLISMDK